MTSNGYSSRWLFSILGYNHWEVSWCGEPQLQVVLNAADRSVGVQFYTSDAERHNWPPINGAYKRWAKWIREIEVPLP